MSDKFKGKYRNNSARLQNWDYASNAAYFITICTKNREHYFGEIKNGKMQVSPAGTIAYVFWYEIKNHTQYFELGEFVVMPNHVHGILILNGDSAIVGTTHALSLRNPSSIQYPLPHQPDNNQTPGQRRFQNQGKNTVSSIVGSYKSAVTKYCNRLKLQFAWQTRFYDHIIRDDKSFQQISEYIKNNPANWKDDKFY